MVPEGEAGVKCYRVCRNCENSEIFDRLEKGKGELVSNGDDDDLAWDIRV